MTKSKRCPQCGKTKRASEFSPDGHKRDGLASKCKGCDRARSRAYYAANRERKAAYYAAQAAEVAETRAALRAGAVRVYGGACEVCGSTEGLEFDHPNGDGKAHREVEQPAQMFRRIVASGERITDWTVRLLCGPHHQAFTAEQRAAEAAYSGGRGSEPAATRSVARRSRTRR